MPRLLTVAAVVVQLVPSSALGQNADAIVWPADLPVPLIAHGACPGEGCMFDAGLACADITMYTEPAGSEVAGHLSAGDTVSVLDGEVHVTAPGRVEVLRDLEIEATTGTSPGEYFQQYATARFAAGDTVYVLNYLGEGHFSVWHSGRYYQLEVFWPWERRSVRRGHVYDGRVLSERSTTFWMNVRTADSVAGWIVDHPTRFSMSSHYMPREELGCRPQ